jgi:arsenite methyltransferase
MTAVSLALDDADLAQHYEQVSAERQFKAGQALVRSLGPLQGKRVLDIGAGTGLLAAYTADLVGPRGAVIGIDPLPLRIEIARRKARPNLSFEVANAYDLSRFPESGFDAVYLNAVLHWLPEKREPLRQIARVLKPGGTLGITTGAKRHQGSLQKIRSEVLSRPPYDRYPELTEGAARRVDPAELDRLLDEAGFVQRSIEVRASVSYQPDAEAAIRFAEASSFGNFLGHLPAEIRPAARRDIARALEAERVPEGIRRDSARIFATAVRR